MSIHVFLLGWLDCLICLIIFVSRIPARLDSWNFTSRIPARLDSWNSTGRIWAWLDPWNFMSPIPNMLFPPWSYKHTCGTPNTTTSLRTDPTYDWTWEKLDSRKNHDQTPRTNHTSDPTLEKSDSGNPPIKTTISGPIAPLIRLGKNPTREKSDSGKIRLRKNPTQETSDSWRLESQNIRFEKWSWKTHIYRRRFQDRSHLWLDLGQC